LYQIIFLNFNGINIDIASHPNYFFDLEITR
jgi:hypothetical protein